MGEIVVLPRANRGIPAFSGRRGSAESDGTGSSKTGGYFPTQYADIGAACCEAEAPEARPVS